MREGHTTVTRRLDYAPPAFWIDTVDLTFDLDPTKTRVLNKMTLRRNPDQAAQPLKLDGDELNLARVLVNGQGTSFRMEGEQLVLESLPEGHEPFELEIFTTCNPEKNTKLMGLFLSGGAFFTQCEAEGFRRITYFIDRPDVMASYTVTLRADKAKYPVLLSNGNLVDEGELEGGRHFAKWQDPHKKPSYLFAVVAGQLVAREQRIISRSGGEHLLQVYVRPGDLDQTEHAMNSLIHSVLWDEARFGLPLDLERFMIVATSDFNAGAMENKGLNIFNTKYVLAKPSTATDADFDAVESVIGHEYFHNWTGNRVTCRDWFQLSLKEGLTVFRDQEFSMDLASTPSARAVKRIENVIDLRSAQFPEDGGPMAHPVRPDEYLEIGNFYTSTVYEKGAEVVRMYQTLVGRDGFRKGMDLYFQRHDGQAVTCDDFAQALADANPDSDLPRLLPQFKRWYSQSGTPVVKAEGNYDAAARTYTLKLSQSCPPTPGQPVKEPFVIPVRLGLVAEDGRDLPLRLEQGSLSQEQGEPTGSMTYVLTEPQATLTFVDVGSEPVPSLMRGFSAPVKLDCNYTSEQLLRLLAKDSDSFNRWEAGQQLGLRVALNALSSSANALPERPLDDAYIAALREVLRHPDLDAAFKALVLSLPDDDYIAEQMEEMDPQRIHAVREAISVQLATELRDDWEWAYEQYKDTGAYQPDPVSSGRRSLAGMALSALCVWACKTNDAVWPGKAYQRFKDAGNMTDRLNALGALLNCGHELAERALTRYYELFRAEPLALDKWFSLQVLTSDRSGNILPIVQKLTRHPDFSLRTPNRARSVLSSYCHGNLAGFHRLDGAGYTFWADRVIELDKLNPQVASRLARAMDQWARLAQPYRQAALAAIERVAAKTDLSNDVREVITRTLAAEATDAPSSEIHEDSNSEQKANS
ncbi:aminopeptidase N [Ottowia thiooxydans]|uniref:aminopeptidase N n=1 Tax=Ottowia thiooxydans TaxID=219182 RepID=UPI0003F56619|nr:aminopeptidase N [Ottowia thiooxydans]